MALSRFPAANGRVRGVFEVAQRGDLIESPLSPVRAVAFRWAFGNVYGFVPETEGARPREVEDRIEVITRRVDFDLVDCDGRRVLLPASAPIARLVLVRPPRPTPIETFPAAFEAVGRVANRSRGAPHVRELFLSPGATIALDATLSSTAATGAAGYRDTVVQTSAFDAVARLVEMTEHAEGVPFAGIRRWLDQQLLWRFRT